VVVPTVVLPDAPPNPPVPVSLPEAQAMNRPEREKAKATKERLACFTGLW
jgi:hypothetical protein